MLYVVVCSWLKAPPWYCWFGQESKREGRRAHGDERHALLDGTKSTPLCRLHTSMTYMHAAVLYSKYGAVV
jgi:hypothetical protein